MLNILLLNFFCLFDTMRYANLCEAYFQPNRDSFFLLQNIFFVFCFEIVNEVDSFSFLRIVFFSKGENYSSSLCLTCHNHVCVINPRYNFFAFWSLLPSLKYVPDFKVDQYDRLQMHYFKKKIRNTKRLLLLCSVFLF